MLKEDSSNPKESDEFIPRLFVIIPTLVTLGLATTVWLAKFTDSQRVQGVWTLVGVVLGLAIAILYRHFELFKNLGETRTLLGRAIESNNLVIRLNQRMAKIESSLMSNEQYERLCLLNDAMGAIAGTRLKLATFSDLIRWKEERIFGQWHTALADLSNGIIEIDDTKKELLTNEIFLRTIPRQMVRAVSFEDEEFWNSREGASFLEAHLAVTRAKGVRITRIFIIDENEEKYRTTFQQQRAHGINVRYVPRSHTAGLHPEDFVIYDDSAVRIGFRPNEEAERRGKLINKFARVTVRAREIEHYVETFDVLLKRSSEPPIAEGGDLQRRGAE